MRKCERINELHDTTAAAAETAGGSSTRRAPGRQIKLPRRDLSSTPTNAGRLLLSSSARSVERSCIFPTFPPAALPADWPDCLRSRTQRVYHYAAVHLQPRPKCALHRASCICISPKS
ncbi:hypothetical protein TWF696_008748 [Orbilia brochopaga]|uniref:Uncharacterized protein n=1 Tax=Orbilia brochopaga TaxID=3140254 RepID=A0AAV9UI12_9PEZI